MTDYEEREVRALLRTHSWMLSLQIATWKESIHREIRRKSGSSPIEPFPAENPYRFLKYGIEQRIICISTIFEDIQQQQATGIPMNFLRLLEF